MATIIDQSFSTPADEGGHALRYDTNRLKLSISFVPTITADIKRISFKLSKNGVPTGNVWAEIYSNNAGAPNALLATGGTLDVSTLTGSGVWHDFDFSAGTILSTGVTYHAVLNGDYTVSTSNWALLASDNTLTTYGGSSYEYNGASWVSNDTDFQFKEYYEDSSTTTSSSTSTSTSSTSTSSSTSSSTTQTTTSVSTSTTISTSTSTTLYIGTIDFNPKIEKIIYRTNE